MLLLFFFFFFCTYLYQRTVIFLLLLLLLNDNISSVTVSNIRLDSSDGIRTDCVDEMISLQHLLESSINLLFDSVNLCCGSTIQYITSPFLFKKCLFMCLLSVQDRTFRFQIQA